MLLHLLPLSGHREAYTVPQTATQAGISKAVGIRVAHASRELGKLSDQHLIDSRDAAVAGSRRRLRVYFLTATGERRARLLAAERGSPEEPANEDAARGGDPVVARDFPEVRDFYGRADALASALASLRERPLLVVLGIAGIGKSTFGARLFKAAAPRGPAAWVSIREFDTVPSVLAPVARMLAMTGRPRLEALLRREAEVELARVRESVAEDLASAGAYVFLDDVQNAGADVVPAVRLLKDAVVAGGKGAHLVLLSRVRPPVYDERDLRVSKAAREIELGGLSAGDAAKMLGSASASGEARAVHRMTGGHPLFIELLRDSAEKAPAASHDPRPLDRFVAEQILRNLSASEREALRRTAFFARPMEPRAFLSGGASFDALLALEGRSLVRRDSRGRVIAHEAIRDFVRRTLTRSEETRYARQAYHAVFEAAEAAESSLDPAQAIEHFEDALALAPSPAETTEVLAELAACHLTLGQYSQASARLREALGAEGGGHAAGAGVYYLMAAVQSESGAPGPAREFLDRAWQSLDTSPPRLGAARARVALEFARWEQRYGSPRASLEWLVRAQKAAEGHDAALVEAEACILRSHITPCDTSNAELDRAIDLATRGGFLPTLSRAHMMYAWHLVDAYGDTGRALDHGEAALRAANAIGNPGLASLAQAAMAKALWRRGDLEGALERAKAAMEGGGERSGDRIVPMALLSTLTTESGDPKRGEEIARRILGAAGEGSTPFESIMARRALMRALVAQKRHDEALEILRSLHETYVARGSDCDLPNHIGTLMRLIRMEAARGKQSEARKWKVMADALLPSLNTPVAEVFRNLCEGHLHSVDDPGVAALAYFRASRALGAIGWSHMHARILQASWIQARAARDAGRTLPPELPPLDEMRVEIGELAGRLKIPGRGALAALAEL